jgi:hypothetical protein
LKEKINTSLVISSAELEREIYVIVEICEDDLKFNDVPFLTEENYLYFIEFSQLVYLPKYYFVTKLQ